MGRLRINACLQHRLAKPMVLGVMLLPFAWLLYGAVGNHLGANPAQALVRATGDWTLRSLCVVLSITPLRIITGVPALARFRRMLGLFVFFYALLHGLSYCGFDRGFEGADIAQDILKRPFIAVGFSALVLLTVLALTSFAQAVKTLGAQRWRALHRSVYAVAGLAVLHFFWMRAGKNDFLEVAVYASVLGGLLAWRGVRFFTRGRG